jgi:3-dehydroquinate synthetase
VAECALAEGLGVAAAGLGKQVAGLLERLGLPVRLAAPIDPEQVVRAMGSDKKNRGATMRFALPRELGAMDAGERWTRAAPEGAIREALGVIA